MQSVQGRKGDVLGRKEKRGSWKSVTGGGMPVSESWSGGCTGQREDIGS